MYQDSPEPYVLVTGATGFVGGHLVKRSVKERKVRCLLRATSDPNKVDKFRNCGADIMQGDVKDKRSLEQAVRGVETVIHLVGIIREEEATYEQIHIEGIKNLVDACKFAPIPKSKAKFQLVYVGDLIQCIISSLSEERITNKTYEIGRPDPLTLDKIAENIKGVLNARALKIHIPLFLLKFMAKLTDKSKVISAIYEKIFFYPPTTAEQLKMLQIDNTCNTEEIERDFSITLTPFSKALKEYA